MNFWKWKKATILVVGTCIGKRAQTKSKCQGLLFKGIRWFTFDQASTSPRHPAGAPNSAMLSPVGLPALATGQQAFFMVKMNRHIACRIAMIVVVLFLSGRFAHPQDSTAETSITIRLEQQDPEAIDLLFSNYKQIPREQCRAYTLQALDYLLKSGNTEKTAKAYLLLGILEKYLGHNDKALLYCDTALFLYERTGDIRGQINANLNIGIVYKNLSDYYQSIEYHKHALALSLQEADSSLVASAYGNLGCVYLDYGDYEKSLEYQLRCLGIHQRLGDRYVPNDLNNIANIYNLSGNHRESITYYQQAARLFEASGDVGYQANALYNAGSAFNELNQTDSALTYIDHALDLWGRIGNKLGSTYALNLQGKIHYKKGSFEKAKTCFHQSLGILENMGNKAGVANALLNLGELYLTLNRVDSAGYFLFRAYNLADSLGNINISGNTYEQLYRLHLSKKDTADALRYYLLYRSAQDSLFNLEKNRTLMEMKTRYETDIKEMENAELRKSLKIAQRHRLFFMINLAVLAVLLFLLAMVFILVNRSQRQKKLLLEQKNRLLDQERELIMTRNQALKDILEIKNKEIICISMATAKRNEYLKTMVDKLNHNHLRLSQAHRFKINQIVRQLQKNTDDEVWKDFEIRFKQVHQSFYTNLNSNFPNLTTNEKKLCAFLKLDMSTKEIAEVTCNSTKSIDIARSRLRNKLELERSQNLSTFLQQF